MLNNKEFLDNIDLKFLTVIITFLPMSDLPSLQEETENISMILLCRKLWDIQNGSENNNTHPRLWLLSIMHKAFHPLSFFSLFCTS